MPTSIEAGLGVPARCGLLVLSRSRARLLLLSRLGIRLLLLPFDGSRLTVVARSVLSVGDVVLCGVGPSCPSRLPTTATAGGHEGLGCVCYRIFVLLGRALGTVRCWGARFSAVPFEGQALWSVPYHAYSTHIR